MYRTIIITLFLLLVLHASGGEKQSPNQALIDKASECINSGRLDEALKIDLGLADKLKDEKDLDIHVNVYNDLGVIYRRLNKNDSAIYYYNKALDAAVKLGDKERLAALSINLAVFYHNLKHFKEAAHYADMGVKYSKQQDDESLRFFALQVASAIKVEVKDYDQTLKYGREAWAMANGKRGNNDMRLRCIPSLTLVFDGMGQTDSVFHYLDIGSRILDSCDNEITRIGFIQNRGDMYYRHQRWGDALRDMLALTKVGGTPYAPLYRKIADCYKHLGDFSRAYCYMDSARMWTDSLSAKDMNAKLAELDVKYKTKEKEMQLAEERSQHAESVMKWMVVAFVVSLLVVILLFVLLVVRHRHKLHLMFVRQCAEMNEARQYIKGLETERSRMARELHDSVSNGLLGVSMKMKGADSPEDIDAVISDVERLRNEVRTLSHGMMPPEFSKYSLNEIMGFYVSGIKGVNAQYEGCDNEGFNGLSEDVSLEVFRIAQECISNAIRHSETDMVKVTLSVDEDKKNGILKVENKGKSKEAVSDGNGIGFRIIQERVKTIGGHIDIQNSADGTVISLIFPL